MLAGAVERGPMPEPAAFRAWPGHTREVRHERYLSGTPDAPPINTTSLPNATPCSASASASKPSGSTSTTA